MARHRYRSQPSLQRSGGPTVPAVAALSLIAAIGVGGGVVVGRFLENLPAPVPGHNAGPIARVADGTPVAVDQPAAALAAPAPQAAVAQAGAEPDVQTEPAAPSVVRVKTKTPAHRPQRATHTSSLPLAKPPSAQEQWEQQRVDYEIARAAYDASEREEGFRWAQRNNIRVQRYCRAAAQPASFVEGCMKYLRPARNKSAATPQPPSESHASDEG